MIRLDDWTIMSRTDLYGNAYQRLIGYDSDGKNIMSGKLIKIDLDQGIAIDHYGVIYKLGVKSEVN